MPTSQRHSHNSPHTSSRRERPAEDAPGPARANAPDLTFAPVPAAASPRGPAGGGPSPPRRTPRSSDMARLSQGSRWPGPRPPRLCVEPPRRRGTKPDRGRRPAAPAPRDDSQMQHRGLTQPRGALPGAGRGPGGGAGLEGGAPARRPNCATRAGSRGAPPSCAAAISPPTRAARRPRTHRFRQIKT